MFVHIVFSKAALQKRGSIEPMEPPLDPPLLLIGSELLLVVRTLNLLSLDDNRVLTLPAGEHWIDEQSLDHIFINK